jgi:hypothetical protein
MIEQMGPRISSCAMRMAGSTAAKTAGNDEIAALKPFRREPVATGYQPCALVSANIYIGKRLFQLLGFGLRTKLG